MNISELKRGAAVAAKCEQGGNGFLKVDGSGCPAQVKALVRKETKEGKPFYELGLQDATAELLLRVWTDHPSFLLCQGLKVGDGICLTGNFTKSDYGIESKDWRGRVLDELERSALLAGSPERKAKLDADCAVITRLIGTMKAGPLRDLCVSFIDAHEVEFVRAGAARGNHHARRGGLVEHVVMMMRAADALCGVYVDLDRDLLLAGVLFHDCGKIVENQFEAQGFVMPYSLRAECYGHIAIAVLIVHRLWSEMGKDGKDVKDRRDLDLLSHLILSHHGQLDWGSPVEPKCREAMILHFIDNIDAKLEMVREAMVNNAELAPGVLERSYPFKHNLIRAGL